jgi:hypothetical protein
MITLAQRIRIHIENNSFRGFDGPNDPLQEWATQAKQELDAEITAAGGLENWRRLHQETVVNGERS